MALAEADELRRIADLIDRFPKFIRRDKGSTSVQAAIRAILDKHGIDDVRLERDLEQLTAEYRQTIANYYERQFGL
jgi:Zn-dependent membrane protease YugP